MTAEYTEGQKVRDNFERTVRKLPLLAATLIMCAGICQSQDHKIRIFLTGTDQTQGNSSNVSAAEVGKALDKHCPEVVLTIEQ
jgi:hypothetical protein